MGSLIGWTHSDREKEAYLFRGQNGEGRLWSDGDMMWLGLFFTLERPSDGLERFFPTRAER